MPLSHGLFRNYDIRGEYGKELTEDAVFLIARGYAAYTHAARVVIGYDARSSSPSLCDAAVKGLVESGISVTDIGMVSTDVLYFAAWHGGFDGGIMITASHMPKQYNGMKFLRLDENGVLAPIGRGLGMEELEHAANVAEEAQAAGGKSERKEAGANRIAQIVAQQKETGAVEQADIWNEYAAFVRSFVDVSAIGPLSVVMDAGNGMGGVVAEKVYAGMNLSTTKLFFEPDGTFPNHDPNPIIPKNREDIIAKVKEVGADLGVAWDADCDRCYFIDERGEFVNGDFITALLAKHFLEKNPGAGVVYDVRSSWAVQKTIDRFGGRGYRARVGHTFIKPKMRDTNSIFGGEMSGHYYFADNKFMDNGFIPSLIVMEMLGKSGKKVSELISELGSFFVSGEINFEVIEPVQDVLARIEAHYAGKASAIDKLDGVSVEFPEWHCNVRPSANDPVVRLNLEAKSKALLQEKLEEVSGLIGGKQAE